MYSSMYSPKLISKKVALSQYYATLQLQSNYITAKHSPTILYSKNKLPCKHGTKVSCTSVFTLRTEKLLMIVRTMPHPTIISDNMTLVTDNCQQDSN